MTGLAPVCYPTRNDNKWPKRHKSCTLKNLQKPLLSRLPHAGGSGMDRKY